MTVWNVVETGRESSLKPSNVYIHNIGGAAAAGWKNIYKQISLNKLEALFYPD